MVAEASEPRARNCRNRVSKKPQGCEGRERIRGGGYSIQGSAPNPGWVLHLIPLETGRDDKNLPSCITGSAAFPKLSFPQRVSRAGPKLCSPGSSVRGVSPCPHPPAGHSWARRDFDTRWTWVCVRKSSERSPNLEMLREGVQRELSEPAALRGAWSILLLRGEHSMSSSVQERGDAAPSQALLCVFIWLCIFIRIFIGGCAGALQNHRRSCSSAESVLFWVVPEEHQVGVRKWDMRWE